MLVTVELIALERIVAEVEAVTLASCNRIKCGGDGVEARKAFNKSSLVGANSDLQFQLITLMEDTVTLWW